MRNDLFAPDPMGSEHCRHKGQVYAVYVREIEMTSKLERHFSVCPQCRTALRKLLVAPPESEKGREEFREWIEWTIAELDFLDAEDDRQVN